MNQQRLLFEYSPALILVCVALGILYAYILYNSKQNWGKTTNRILFLFRAILVSFLAFLLIGPILKLTLNDYEKPTLLFLVDNSVSIGEAVDSLELNNITAQVEATVNKIKSQGYDVQITTLDASESNEIKFNEPTSDLYGVTRNKIGQFEGKNLAGLVVISDGIYNSGSSPLYSPMRVPVYTVGLGDTTERVDIALRNVYYNKIAYQGNQFPIRAEVLLSGLPSQEVVASVYKNGRLMARDRKNSADKSILDFDFQLEASEKGLQRIDIAIEPLGVERNKKNNFASAFIDVVEGKKKILLVAPAPHPDIKVLRAVVEKNANYEFKVHIPGVKEASPEELRPENIDLAIFQQALDYGGKTMPLFQKLVESNSGILVMLGSRSNIRQLSANGIQLNFENPGQWDAITPILNPGFKDFGFSDNINNIFSRYPPINVPFGKFSYPADASIMLYQRIGRVNTERPLLYTTSNESQKMAVVLGDGIWRWRLDEYAETQKTDGFDEVFSKLIQYLCTREDKRKFRCFPSQNEFTTSEAVVFESQVYNELFEQVYGQKIEIELTNEKGETYQHSYVTSPGGSRYRMGGLQEGVYKYSASTEINGSLAKVGGEFLVVEQNIESQNLTADFNLLRKWSANTGGKFYKIQDLDQLSSDFSQIKAQSRIHTEESFNPLINLKIVFFFLLALISVEWFARKYLGGY